MAMDLRAKRASFRALHREGCFVLPNPWDLGGIRRLEKAGFKALASTSSGAAWAMGRNDGELSRDEVLEHLRFLCAAIKDLSALAELVSVVAPKPVNALLLGPEMHVAGLADAGVRRVSTGGGLAAAAWAGFDNALRLLIEKGTLPKRQ
jgi:2-methylisocitrate lyase-like PEP mutase family enzyme